MYQPPGTRDGEIAGRELPSDGLQVVSPLGAAPGDKATVQPPTSRLRGKPLTDLARQRTGMKGDPMGGDSAREWRAVVGLGGPSDLECWP